MTKKQMLNDLQKRVLEWRDQEQAWSKLIAQTDYQKGNADGQKSAYDMVYWLLKAYENEI